MRLVTVPTALCLALLSACGEPKVSSARNAHTVAAELAANAELDEASPHDSGTALHEIESKTPDLATTMKQNECETKQSALMALHRMQDPPPGEIITTEERDSIPAEIVKAENYIANNCK